MTRNHATTTAVTATLTTTKTAVHTSQPSRLGRSRTLVRQRLGQVHTLAW